MNPQQELTIVGLVTQVRRRFVIGYCISLIVFNVVVFSLTMIGVTPGRTHIEIDILQP